MSIVKTREENRDIGCERSRSEGNQQKDIDVEGIGKRGEREERETYHRVHEYLDEGILL